MVSWDFQAVFELLPFQMWKISQNLAKFLGTSLKTRIQQLITQEELEKPRLPFKCLICSFLQASKLCKSFVLEMCLKFHIF
jgi:hypothetical protein